MEAYLRRDCRLRKPKSLKVNSCLEHEELRVDGRKNSRTGKRVAGRIKVWLAQKEDLGERVVLLSSKSKS